MELHSTFDIGDRGWVFVNNKVQQMTVGKIILELIDSPGEMDPWKRKGNCLSYSGSDPIPDNYKPQKSFKEEYQCVEGGIGSGWVFELGKTIFLTRDACEIAFENLLREQAAEREAQKQREDEAALHRYNEAKRTIRNYLNRSK